MTTVLVAAPPLLVSGACHVLHYMHCSFKQVRYMS
jgi:hypothetical protein